MHDVIPSIPSPWLASAKALRHRLVILAGVTDTLGALHAIRQVVEDCVVMNLSLALSQRLLDLPSQQRPIQAPLILAELLAGDAPLFLYNVELLFEPALQLEPLGVLKSASRRRILFIQWPGDYDGHGLVYALPGHPEYRRYAPADLTDILIAPMTEITAEI